nr:protein S100-P [Cavia porcellus]
MTELETAMGLVINVFARYAPGRAASRSAKDKDTVDKLLKDLDANGDAEVDFNEFIVFVAALTSACHSYFVKAGPV